MTTHPCRCRESCWASPAASPRTRAAELTRLFVKAGVTVDVCMTDAAVPLHHAADAAGAVRPAGAHRTCWASGADNGMGHIRPVARRGRDRRRARRRPTFSRSSPMAIADDLLSTLALARDCRLFVAPAMNRQMWANAANQRNVAQLAADGVVVLGPGTGEQACGETGDGRMLEPEEIFAAVMASAQPKLPRGQARAAHRGSDVRGDRSGARHHQHELGQDGFRAGAGGRRGRRHRARSCSGPTPLPTPAGRRARSTSSAPRRWRPPSIASLAASTRSSRSPRSPTTRPPRRRRSKVKKTDAPLTIALKPTVDILADRRGAADAPYCVGFAAETERRRPQRRRKSGAARSCR